MIVHNRTTVTYSIDPIILYKDLFDDKVNIEYLLDKVTFRSIVDFTTTILVNDLNVVNHQKLLREIMSDNSDFKYIIKQLNNNDETRSYSRYNFFSQLSSLRLLEFALRNKENFKIIDCHTNKEIILNLIKLNLIFNQNEIDKQNEGSGTIDVDDPNLELKLFISYSLPQIEFTIYDLLNYASIILKKFELLTQFLDEKEDWNKITAYMLGSMGLSSLLHFKLSFIELVKSTLVKNNGLAKKIILSLNKNDPNYNNSKFILEFLSRSQIETDQDFLLIRKNPLYKFSEDSYAILFTYFLIKKFDTGIYFELNDGFKALPKEDQKRISRANKIKKEYFFKSPYGKEFIEEFMVPRVFQPLFNDNNALILSDDDIFKKYNLKGKSDLYIRDKNNIFVIESKDILIPTGVKTSYNYNEIEKFLIDRLDTDKGIPQVVKNIKAILKEPIVFDPDCQLDSISNIYPIIIVNDESFNALGISFLLNEWFKDRLISEELIDPRIKPLTLLTIDSIVQIGIFGDLEITIKPSLNKLLDAYHKTLSIPDNSQYSSFAHFFSFFAKTDALIDKRYLSLPQEPKTTYGIIELPKKRKKMSKGEKKTNSRNKQSPNKNRKQSKRKNK